MIATRASPKGLDMKAAFRLCIAVVAIRVAAAQSPVARVLASFWIVSTCVWKVDKRVAAVSFTVAAVATFARAACKLRAAEFASEAAVFNSNSAASIASPFPVCKIASYCSCAAATASFATSTCKDAAAARLVASL